MNIFTEKVFAPHVYTIEDDFEARVLELADKIFGEQSIYLAIKKKLRAEEVNVIPDGYLVDMTIPSKPKLYLVENEIVSHDPFSHIGIQLLKFSVNYDASRPQIKQIVMKHIVGNPAMKARLEQGCKLSDARNIDDYLERAIDDEFKAVVIIDDARPELYKVLNRIHANISVLELKTFINDDSYAFLYDTLYGDDEAIPTPATPDTEDERKKQRMRRANCDTIVVPAQQEGFENTFLAESRFYAVRISAAMKERINYIAVYQTDPISAVTYIAEINEIVPYEDTGKYLIEFKAPAERLPQSISVREGKNAPQGPIYVKREKLLSARYLEDAL